MVEVGLGEPAVDPGRDGARLLGGAVGRGERLGPLGQLLERLAADRLAGLDDDDRGLAPAGRSPRAARRTATCPARRAAPTRPSRRGPRAPPRAGSRSGRWRSRAGSARERAVTCWRANAASACSAWARTASVTPAGTRCITDDGRVVAVGERVGEPQRELGVGAAADRDEDPPDVARAALLDDRDVARRLAHDLVDRRRDHRAAARRGGGRTCRPSRRSSGRLPARRPPRRCRRPRGGRSGRAGGSPCPRARSRGPSGAAGGPAGRASRPRTAACPRAPRRCPSAVSSPVRGSISEAPIRISSSAVSGFATGIRIRDGSGCARPRGGSAVVARVHRGPPAVDEVGLEQLELARLALDPLLGVGRRQVPRSR